MGLDQKHDVDADVDADTANPTHPTLNTIDFNLQIGVEEILTDVDPDVSLEFLQKAEAHSGKPPPTRIPRDTLVSTHNEYVEQQQKSGQQSGPRMVKKVVLALSYPPSVKSAEELSPMRLDELLVENHHEDKYVVLRTIAPPYTGAGTITIVEDQYGSVDKMALYNQGSSTILQFIPEGSLVLVKEPYYRFGGDDDFMLCVDHPSDIMLLRQGPDDALIPKGFKAAPVFENAADWKADGDRAFISNNLPLAVANYTRALELATEEDKSFRTDVLSKRAGINLTLKCFDNALSDALSSRGGSSDWKAYFLAAKASYELPDFQNSKQYFESALEMKPEATNIRKDYKRCLERLEEEKGNYDLAGMTASVTSKNIHIDRASFLSRTEVKDSPHHGRGLFARENIKAGEIIFAEKATSVPDEFNPEHNSAAAYAQLVELCADNPTIHNRVLDLHGGSYKRTGREGALVDGRPVVDVFLLESIRRKNCFSGARVSAQAANPEWDMWRQGMSRGLWVYSAYANHACLPNANRSFIGDVLIATATVDIPAGTEITHIYLPPKAAYLLRLPQFRRSWGFVCSCALCAGEAGSATERHEKRNAALAEIEALIRRKRPTKFYPDATIRQVEKLTNKLEALHEKEVYDDLALPRLMLVWPTMWLAEVWHTRKQWNKVVKWGGEVFRNFGFVHPVRDGRLWMYKDTLAVTTFEVLRALKWSSEAYAALGQQVLAEDCLDAARTGLKTMVGFVTDETFAAFK
ncbi:TPR domain-containing protein [Colletotrichum orchidophilum]|uniref:TPR domain-containing protein n=1 Tax=Colletotrichum orchidophilum TaxID=1209926 RepID=A0A1G4ATX0_9PEZI|nr:TPR domain-containing protein [Colletotrichum orchidophilum]OHE92502.1 TPR domain-containing protein [Colletotrichum orchidophilum]